MAFARYYLALRLSAAMVAPLPARPEWFAAPAPIVRSYQAQRRGGFDERELLSLGSQSLVLIRPLNSGESDTLGLN